MEKIKWGALLLALALSAAFIYGRTVLRPTAFAKNLPVDVSFYISLDLPNKLVDHLPDEPAIIKAALAQFKNRLELARFPDGTLILKTRLRDLAAWQSFAAGHLEFKWQIVGKDIYISNQTDITKYARAHQPALADALKRAKVRPGVAMAWLASTDWLAEFPIYQNLAAGLELPMAAVARDYGAYWQWSFGNPVNATRLKVARVFNTQGSLAAGFNGEWARLGGIAGLALLDMASLADKIENYSADLYIDAFGKTPDFTAQNWLVKLQPKPGKSPIDILEPLKQVGIDWFSLTHPLSVVHTLADGSKMTELRAASAGLEWQTENDLSYLRGTGEILGLYLSQRPGGEILLSNSGIFIRDYLEEKGGFSLAATMETVCLAPENSIFRANLKLENNFVPRLTLSLDGGDNWRLCTSFR